MCVKCDTAPIKRQITNLSFSSVSNSRSAASLSRSSIVLSSSPFFSMRSRYACSLFIASSHLWQALSNSDSTTWSFLWVSIRMWVCSCACCLAVRASSSIAMSWSSLSISMPSYSRRFSSSSLDRSITFQTLLGYVQLVLYNPLQKDWDILLK